MNFEQAISRIDNEISIQKEDRESFSKDFDAIRNFLMNIMVQTDPVFKMVYAGPSLFGSYLDNIKIDNPDEFDVHILLKIPFYESIEVTKDCHRPGYVNLNISKPLLQMKKDPNFLLVYQQFSKFVTPTKFLIRSEIRNWLQRIIESALKNYGTSIRNASGTETYKLRVKYFEQGTAHTIKASSESREISIDFVPAFKFNANCNWLADRPFPRHVKEKLWFAVPKPAAGPINGEKLTFSICVPQTEKHLLTGKYNLKPTLRLIKSIRDRTEEGYFIKSYFIKSMYLHENDKQDNEFWMQPPGKLLLHMLDRCLVCLDNKSIQFYWCPSLNLLDNIPEQKLMKLKQNFRSVQNRLVAFSKQPAINYEEIRKLFDCTTKPLKDERS